MPRQVRAVTVTVTQLDDGRWRFTQPRVGGWVAAARTPVEAAAALRQAFTEAQCAAYSDWRGRQYDGLSTPRRTRAPRRAPNKTRCDVHDPGAWRLAGDGRWVSPAGLSYPEDRQVVQRVMAARAAAGLPPRPDQPDTPVQVTAARNVTSMIGRGRTA